MKYKYLISGELAETDEPIFFYKWTIGGGSTEFGGHYTEKEFEVMKVLRKNSHQWKLVSKRPDFHEDILNGRTIVKFETINNPDYESLRKHIIHFDDGSYITLDDFWYKGPNQLTP